MAPNIFPLAIRHSTPRSRAWRAAGLIAPWPAAGEHAFVGTPGMSAPAAAMARGLDVRSDVRIGGLERREEGWCLLGEGVDADFYEAVVVTVPAEQVAALVGPWDARMAAHADTTHSAPCWTLMAAYASRLPLDADVLRDMGPIGWAARNSAKPGRTEPESWVIQGSPDWSRDHLEDEADHVTLLLLDALAKAARAHLPSPIATRAHRWRYAQCGRTTDGDGGPIWNDAMKLGACGDWTSGPRIEAAWMSGHRLAQTILSASIVRC